MEDNKLLPCPFCGAAASLNDAETHARCNDCTNVPWLYVENWNRRTPAASQPEQCMGLTNGQIEEIAKPFVDYQTGYLTAPRAFARAIESAILARPSAPTVERAAVPEGWVSVKDRLPKTEHECTSRDMMVSNSFFVRGTAVDGGEGFGMADYQEDGKWHCYGGDYDFMHITEVTHYLPAAAPSPAAPVAKEGKAQDDGYSTSDQLIPTSRIARLAKQAAQPMCETCDDPAMVLADGTLGLCGACQDFAAMPAAQQTSAQVDAKGGA